MRNDCAIVALSHVTGASYDEVKARVPYTRFGVYLDRWLQTEQHPCLGEGRDIWGYTATRHRATRPQRGQRTPRMADFLAAHPTGRWIVHQRRHAVAVIDGVVCGDERYPNAPVYSCWEFQRL